MDTPQFSGETTPPPHSCQQRFPTLRHCLEQFLDAPRRTTCAGMVRIWKWNALLRSFYVITTKRADCYARA
jgi:hypothetical protein